MPLLTELAAFVLAVAIKIVLLRSKDLQNVLTLGRGTKRPEVLSFSNYSHVRGHRRLPS